MKAAVVLTSVPRCGEERLDEGRVSQILIQRIDFRYACTRVSHGGCKSWCEGFYTNSFRWVPDVVA